MLDIKPSEKESPLISNIDIFILTCGFEDSFLELCNNTSKALLKLLNKPLIAYQLEFLERCGFKQINVIYNPSFSPNIKDYISSEFKSDNLKPLLIPYENEVLDINSIFTIIKHKSNYSNFILMSGDSILNFDLNVFIDEHISTKTLLSIILNDTSSIKNLHLSFSKSKVTEIFGVEEDKNKVVYYAKNDPENDNNNNKLYELKPSLLKHSRKFVMLYHYEDVHFYIFNKSIFAIVDKYQEVINEMRSIKDDLIPFLINKTFYSKINTCLKENCEEHKEDMQSINYLSSKMNVKCKLVTSMQSGKKNVHKEFAYRITNYQLMLALIEQIQKPYNEIDLCLFQSKNNEKNYFVNFAQQIKENLKNKKKFNEGINELKGVTADSFIADPVNKIGDTSRINKSVIGNNLSLNEGSNISGCLLLENVKIGNKCKVSNSIIGGNATIGDNCTIVDCVVQSGYVVKDGVNAKEKVLSKENEDYLF